MGNPLVHTMEARFHGAANASALRELHAKGDWNGLLEYALLLAELEASQRSQIKWLTNEAAANLCLPLRQNQNYNDQ
jgi:hypothetical protein